MDEYNNMNPNPNGSPEPQPQQPDYAPQYDQQPQQPQQPDYASQYNQQPQQPQQPDYASQYNQQPQQPQQPDYASQYNQQPQQPDYASQYNQQPQQPDYASQYNQQPQQPDYSAQYQQYNQTNPDYAQQPYQQNAYNVAPSDQVLAGPAKAFSIVSLVCGIVSMVTCCWGGFLFGIAAIVFSILAKKRYTGKNTMATLGLIFGIIGLVLATISAIIYCAYTFSNSGSYRLR